MPNRRVSGAEVLRWRISHQRR